MTLTTKKYTEFVITTCNITDKLLHLPKVVYNVYQNTCGQPKKIHYQKYNMKFIHKHTINNGHVSAVNSVQNVYLNCSLIYEKTLRCATFTVIDFHFLNFCFIPRYKMIKIYDMLA